MKIDVECLVIFSKFMSTSYETTLEVLEKEIGSLTLTYRSVLADIAFVESCRKESPVVALANIAETFKDYIVREVDSSVAQIDLEIFVLSFRQLYPMRQSGDAFLIASLAETDTDQ